MTREQRDKAIKDIIQHYGEKEQVDVAIEEMAELTHALLKYRRNPCNTTLDGIIEELADVTIMIGQLGYIYFCEEYVERVIDKKLERQIERMSAEKA